MMVFGLALAAYDGFRDRDRVRTTVEDSENGTVHTQGDMAVVPPR